MRFRLWQLRVRVRCWLAWRWWMCRQFTTALWGVWREVRAIGREQERYEREILFGKPGGVEPRGILHAHDTPTGGT